MSRAAPDAFIFMLELSVGRLLPDELLLSVKLSHERRLCTSKLLVDDAVSLCLG
jgi:hypothetical protein